MGKAINDYWKMSFENFCYHARCVVIRRPLFLDGEQTRQWQKSATRSVFFLQVDRDSLQIVEPGQSKNFETFRSEYNNNSCKQQAYDYIIKRAKELDLFAIANHPATTL